MSFCTSWMLCLSWFNICSTPSCSTAATLKMQSVSFHTDGRRFVMHIIDSECVTLLDVIWWLSSKVLLMISNFTVHKNAKVQYKWVLKLWGQEFLPSLRWKSISMAYKHYVCRSNLYFLKYLFYFYKTIGNLLRMSYSINSAQRLTFYVSTP